MALDSSVLAQTATPPSPLEILARVQAIRNAQQQQQIGAQQLQGAQLENQQKQLDLQDQQNFRQAYMQANGDPEQALKIASQKGVSPKTAVAFQQQIMGLAKTRADLSNTQMDVLQKKHDALNSLLAPVEAEQDPAVQAPLFEAAKQKAITQGLISPQEAQSITYGGPATVHALRASLNTEKYITAQAAQMRANAELPGLQAKAQSDQLDLLARGIDNVTDQASYQALLKTAPPNVVAKLPTTFDPATTRAAVKRLAVPTQQQPNFDIEAAKANALKAFAANPQAAIAQIDQILPPNVAGNAQINQSYKTLLQASLARGDVDAAKNTLQHALDYAAGIAKETNPQVIGARVGQAVATAKATAPIEVQKEVDKQIALAKQSPDAFAGIVDGPDRRAAETEADKVAKEYADKIGSSQQLVYTINSALKGNKVAPGVIPVELLRSYVNRVNKTELQAVSAGVGSVVDRVQTWLSKNTTGEPPAWLLNDVKSLATIQSNAAERGWNAGVQRLKTRGVDTTKLAKPDLSAPPAAPQYKAGDTRQINGVTYTRDASGNWTAK